MKKINEQLKKLYGSNELGLKEISSANRLNGPLLMQCDEDLYFKANKKILIIGQECPMGDEVWVDVEYCMNWNSDEKSNSIFWQGAHAFNNMFNNELSGTRCFMWTNVSKFSAYDGKPLGNEDDFRFCVDNFNVLKEEIKIIEPDIVIFFSGYKYDDKIKQQFEEGDLEFTEINERYEQRELAKIFSRTNSLPQHTYRTYHPRYLRQSKQWHFISEIVAQIEGCDTEELKQKLHTQLTDNFTIDSNFGEKDSGITYKPKNWHKYKIRFEFSGDNFSDIRYGINAIKNPGVRPDVAISINKCLSDTEPLEDENWWPYWKWFAEGGRNADIFQNINKGIFSEKIKNIVSVILESTSSLTL